MPRGDKEPGRRGARLWGTGLRLSSARMTQAEARREWIFSTGAWAMLWTQEQVGGLAQERAASSIDTAHLGISFVKC